MIYGERIRLRSITRTDLPLFVEWLNDPEVTHGLVHYLPFSLEDEENWFENMLKMPREEHPLMIDIRSEQGWEAIGDCAVFNIDWRIRQAEFGIVIGAKHHWNKGYGTEALSLTIQHCFETLNLNRVYLRVYENNPRAQRAYEKAGMSIEGRMRQAHYDNGKYVDVILMSILRSEWQENK
ncbi:MAG TPA: N-acetyltransferase [Chloroflexi bacterium]|nr:N-acetyltransferase [Chloroflexota bacterium]HBY08665.1 N-acetyltransferase [Chloroflexota bacterium]